MFETQNPTILLASKIRLNPLSQQLENDVLIVGWGDQFLELPAEGAQFIAWLIEGLTLALLAYLPGATG